MQLAMLIERKPLLPKRRPSRRPVEMHTRNGRWRSSIADRVAWLNQHREVWVDYQRDDAEHVFRAMQEAGLFDRHNPWQGTNIDRLIELARGTTYHW